MRLHLSPPALRRRSALRRPALLGALALTVGACADDLEPTAAPEATAPQAAVNQIFPNHFILVHGYAPPGIQGAAAAGIDPVTQTSHEDNFWYWRSKYSDTITAYDVPAKLREEAAEVGEVVQVHAANWDGRSKIADSVVYLERTLDAHCLIASAQTCALIGHSTGDAIIGYVLDKHRTAGPTGGLPWNITGVYVAGGAGGGTEIAYVAKAFFSDPVLTELTPDKMRRAYNHDMPAGVPNVRFVGAGWRRDDNSATPYPEGSMYLQALVGDSDGLVPFHSQAGVKPFAADWYDSSRANAYCIRARATYASGCGRVYHGTRPAERWNPLVPWGGAWSEAPLFEGFTVAFIDSDRHYNHSDEVGKLGDWVPAYLREHASPIQPPPPPPPPPPPGPITTFPTARPKPGITLQNATTMVEFAGALYAVMRANDPAGTVKIARSSDGVGWSEVPIPGAGTAVAPSLTVWKGTLYVSYVVAGGPTIAIAASPDGTSWTSYPITGSHASGAPPQTAQRPALAVFDHTLYLAYRGLDGALWTSRSTDGQVWTSRRGTTSGGTLSLVYGPGLAIYQGKLFAGYRAPSGHLAIASSNDGATWDRYELTGDRSRSGPITTESVASLAVYNGRLYAATQAVGSHQVQLSHTTDGATWTTTNSPAVLTGGGPGLGVFGRSLYLTLRANDPSMTLYVTSATAGAEPAPAWAVFPTAAGQAAIHTASAPAAARFKGELYTAFEANDGSRRLFIAYSGNGTTWSQYSPSGITVGSAPSLAAFGGVLYAAYRAAPQLGIEHESIVHIATSTDGRTWTHYQLDATRTGSGVFRSAAPPRLGVWNNRLYLSGNDGIGGLVRIASSSDGQRWSTRALVATVDGPVFSADSVALAAFAGSLYAAYRANDGSNRLRIAVSHDGTTWTHDAINGDRALNVDAFTSTAPSLATYADRLYAGYVGLGGAALWTSVSDDGLRWSSYPSPQVLTKNAVGLVRFGSGLYVMLQANDSSNLLYVSKIAGTAFGPLAAPTPIRLRTENGQFLTANNGGNLAGPAGKVAVTTTASAIGPLETFSCRVVGLNTYAFQTVNDHYLTAVNGGGVNSPGDTFRTVATVAGTLDNYTLVWLGGPYCALKTRDGTYLTALQGGGRRGDDPAYTPALRTDATRIGPSETFAIQSR
jgi:hypothetical protein